MADETDFLSLFEGLNPRQAQELREAIIPTLQSVREKITVTQENDMQRTVIPEAANSPAKMLIEKMAALRADVTRLEGLRDSAVAQAANAQDAELARVALQGDIDRAREKLTQAEQEYQTIGE